jgi:hypothetical protein
MKGWVTATYRHYKGNRLGPYYFRKWKVGSKIHKEYIKPDQVERIKAACQTHREKQATQREHTKRLNRQIDNWCFLGNMCLRCDRGLGIRPDQEAYAIRLRDEGMFIAGRPLYRPRRVFGVPQFSNFLIDCYERQIDPVSAQLLQAMGASMDQIEQIFKSTDPQTGLEVLAGAFWHQNHQPLTANH